MSQHTDVNKYGEFGIIDHLTDGIKPQLKSTVKAIGDDAAIIANGLDYTVLSTDLLMEGIHFDMMYTPLKHLGYKAIVVNLSDIYAMNVKPSHVTFSMALSSKYSVEALEELYAGVKKACEFYEVDLIGGDTTSNRKGLALSVTALGVTNEKENITLRSTAKVGDVICVTGDLGSAYLGLQLLEREKQLYMDDDNIKPELEKHKYLLERQLKPEAQREAYEYFQKEKLTPTSMIDISDGLSSDLMHICKQSGVGAFLEEGKIPMSDDAKMMALEFNMDPVSCALNGGEDYELLFTVSPQDLDKIKFMPGASIVGEIVDKADKLTLHTTGGNIHPLEAQGWNHFNW